MSVNKETVKKEPFFHVIKRTDISFTKAWGLRLLAILLGLAISFVFLYVYLQINNPRVISSLYDEGRSFSGAFFTSLFEGNFGTVRKTWIALREMSLLLITGLALIPAFKMKFWNLGGNGQILIGALTAIVFMFFVAPSGMPEWLYYTLMIISSILAGALWAVIPAIFKAFFNTNESLFTLMMNYIAAGLVAVFINAVVKAGSGVLNPLSKGGLPNIADNANILTIILAGITLITMFIYLRYNKHGYELSVVGESRNTARYVGINVKWVIIRTLILSGAICGMVGLLIAGSLNHTITITSDGNLGFTAIMVAWLAKFNPIVMVATSFIITFLNQGMAMVQTNFGITNNAISYIVIGLVYFFIIAVEFFVNYQIVRSHSGDKEMKKKYLLLTDGLLALNEAPKVEREEM